MSGVRLVDLRAWPPDGMVLIGCFPPPRTRRRVSQSADAGLVGPLLSGRWAMNVHAVPATITVAPDAQLADVVFADDRADGDFVLFQRRSAGSWQPVTARQFAADVRSLAAGFLAAGIQP